MRGDCLLGLVQFFFCENNGIAPKVGNRYDHSKPGGARWYAGDEVWTHCDAKGCAHVVVSKL